MSLYMDESTNSDITGSIIDGTIAVAAGLAKVSIFVAGLLFKAARKASKTIIASVEKGCIYTKEWLEKVSQTDRKLVELGERSIFTCENRSDIDIQWGVASKDINKAARKCRIELMKWYFADADHAEKRDLNYDMKELVEEFFREYQQLSSNAGATAEQYESLFEKIEKNWHKIESSIDRAISLRNYALMCALADEEPKRLKNAADYEKEAERLAELPQVSKRLAQILKESRDNAGAKVEGIMALYTEEQSGPKENKRGSSNNYGEESQLSIAKERAQPGDRNQ